MLKNKLAQSGRNNPNTKYKSLDDNFFKKIDSKEKAYLLGWIASDGHIAKRGFTIYLKDIDNKIIESLKDIICKEIPVKYKINSDGRKQVGFRINSQEISRDLCKLLNIKCGKKSAVVNFPELEDTYNMYFIRGYFEGDGCIINKNTKTKYPVVSISSNSFSMLKAIFNKTKIHGYVYKNQIVWSNLHAISFLDYIYINSESLLRLDRKYDLYLYWKTNYEYNCKKNKKRGKDHPRFGKPMSEFTKIKLLESNTGENNWQTPLTWEMVKNIRMLYAKGDVSFEALAKMNGVSDSSIGAIIHNETWIDNTYTPIYKRKNKRKVI